ncbi:neutral/alkaline non-lysosomal ceramidase N-terminal domain-containing protein, partial [Estrella lausannensis]
MFLLKLVLSLLCVAYSAHLSGAIKAGVGEAVMTPPVGTPSAGYAMRKGEGMAGEHDPLLAIALYLEADKKVVFCSVDSLGFSHVMAKEIIGRIQQIPGQQETLVLIGSSHTHSGGGGFLDMPPIGEVLAGKYDPHITQFYIDKTVEAIELAIRNPQEARVGIGYGEVNLSKYRGAWPENVKPLPEVALIKVETKEGRPLAAVFNYPMHPTILGADNRLFSADFVSSAREEIKKELGPEVKAIYYNGAQGDIIPAERESTFAAQERVGRALGEEVVAI